MVWCVHNWHDLVILVRLETIYENRIVSFIVPYEHDIMFCVQSNIFLHVIFIMLYVQQDYLTETHRKIFQLASRTLLKIEHPLVSTEILRHEYY